MRPDGWSSSTESGLQADSPRQTPSNQGVWPFSATTSALEFLSYEGIAATALTSISAPGTPSPATRAPTTGGVAPANSAAATG